MRLIEVPSGRRRFQFLAPPGFTSDYSHPWIQTTSHDQTLVLHFPGPTGGIFLIDVETGATRLRIDDRNQRVHVTADGTRAIIRWSEADGSVFRIIECSDGHVITEKKLPLGELINEFSPNGNVVFTERDVRTESQDGVSRAVIALRTVPNLELLTDKEEESGPFSCKFDPMGRYVSYQHNTTGHVVDLSTKPPTWIDVSFGDCPVFSPDGK